MKLAIIWSPTAKQEFSNLLEYVESAFGLDAAVKVLDQTDLVLNGIAAFPEMFPKSTFKNVRKASISKHTSLIYRVTSSEVHLLYFWDNRMNPDWLEERLG